MRSAFAVFKARIPVSFPLAALQKQKQRAVLGIMTATTLSTASGGAGAPVAAQEAKKVVIIGSGPAAHTAAIYLARANLSPVLYEGFLAAGIAAGGQLTTTTDVENFPGFPKGISGSEMMELFKEQSTRFGTEVISETIHRVDTSARPFRLWTEDDADNAEPTLRADAVILATGATAKRLFIKGEDFYWNRGISACAVCDGAVPIFRNRPLAVIGGGDSACEEATFLTRYGSKVYLLVRRDKLRASKVMADRTLANPKIEVLWNTQALEARGDGSVMTGLEIVTSAADGKEEQQRLLDVNGLFYAIGHEPNSKFLKQGAGDALLDKSPIDLDNEGYVVVQPGSTYTNVEGIFACGDLQDKKYRQAITAAGSGCMAALDCERWLESQGE